MAVRTTRLEIVQINGDVKEIRKRWFNLSDQVKQFTNRIWREWLCWHTANDSGTKIRLFLNALNAWREREHERVRKLTETAKAEKRKLGKIPKEGCDPNDPKPKLELTAIPKELSQLLYERLMTAFPELNTRVRSLLLNIVQKKIKERKSAKGVLSAWMSILLDHESVPSSTHPLPIPFDTQNCELIPPLKEGDNFSLRVRVDRRPEDAKVKAPSTVDDVELRTKGRKALSQAKIMQRICDGTYKFCGSNLYYKDGKWFGLISFEIPSDVEKIVSDETAILRPAFDHPWTLKIGKAKMWRGGNGRYVAARRHQLLTDRWSRQEGYRHAGSANKGHGRNRALGPIWHLSDAWKNFVKTCNHTLTRDVVRDCVDRGIGTLIYIQPAGLKRDTRFLAKAGKVQGRVDSTGWDWHQVANMLAYKCEEAGIQFEIRKSGEMKAKLREAV